MMTPSYVSPMYLNEYKGIDATVLERVGVAVFVRGPGPTQEELVLGAVRLNQETGSNYFEVSVANPGNVMTKGAGTLVLSTTDGEEVFDLPVDLGTVLPRDFTLLRMDAQFDPGPGDYVAAIILDRPSGQQSQASPDLTNGAASVSLTATIDDTTTGGSSIQATEYFVDTLGTAGAGTAMAAADGAFDGVSEAVSATVDVSALSLGTHNLFVAGQDSAGNWGGADVGAVDVTAVPAGAEDVSFVLQGGSLSLTTNPVDFGTVAITGLDQTVDTAPAAWTGTDGTGTAAGWNVTVSSSDLTSAGGTITVDNLKIRQEDVNIVTVAGNAAPASQVTSYQPLSGAPLKLPSAAANEGMGTYDFTPDFRLTVPAESAPGTYAAFLTVSINSAP